MPGKVYEGVIDKWIRGGHRASGYGFIEHASGARLQRIFYKWEDIVEDNVGRRFAGQIVGAPVRFRIVKYIDKGQPAVRAVEVQNVFSSDVAEPIEDHREVSRVDHLARNAAFLEREHGDQVFLRLSDVAPHHQHSFHKLQLGDHVWHGVRPPDQDGKIFFATNAEFYSLEEEAAMRGGEVQPCTV